MREEPPSDDTDPCPRCGGSDFEEQRHRDLLGVVVVATYWCTECDYYYGDWER